MQQFTRNFFNNNAQIAQFIRYGVAGGFTASVELVLFQILVWFDLWYLVANISAFLVAVVVGFLLQKYWTFKNRESAWKKQLFKFSIVMCTALVLTNLYMYIFVDIFLWPPFISKCLQLILVMFSNYAGQRYFTFK